MTLKILRLYVDSTVVTGSCSSEYESWSRSLLEDFRSGLYLPVISTLVQAELADASPAVLRHYQDLLQCEPRIIQQNEQAETLADLYVERKILPRQQYHDALHVALATLAEVDILVSWNYQNILHINQVRRFIMVNLELGLKPIQIRSPRVVSSYERESM